MYGSSNPVTRNHTIYFKTFLKSLKINSSGSHIKHSNELLTFTSFWADSYHILVISLLYSIIAAEVYYYRTSTYAMYIATMVLTYYLQLHLIPHPYSITLQCDRQVRYKMYTYCILIEPDVEYQNMDTLSFHSTNQKTPTWNAFNYFHMKGTTYYNPDIFFFQKMATLINLIF